MIPDQIYHHALGYVKKASDTGVNNTVLVDAFLLNEAKYRSMRDDDPARQNQFKLVIIIAATIVYRVQNELASNLNQN